MYQSMRKTIVYLFSFLSLCSLLFSCYNSKQRGEEDNLIRLDELIEESPYVVSDSLSAIEVSDLSLPSRNYYYLLKTIADDKTYAAFDNDSLIAEVESYYRQNEYGARNHIRSLIYLGIVRSRIGMGDSTVYHPLKEALQILQSRDDTDPELSYFASYYLGDIYERCGDDELAEAYFHKALRFAKLKNNSKHLYHIYLALWRVHMRRDDPRKAESYLDTLSLYTQTPEEQYYALNAQSVFLNANHKYLLASQKERMLLAQALQQQRQDEYYKIYYALSHTYYNRHMLDSASYFIEQAIAHIPDSIGHLNYLLHNHAADIAREMHDFRLADDFRQQALHAYASSVDDRLNTTIRELEMRYNHSVAQNRALKAEARNRLLVMGGIILILLAGVFILNLERQRAAALFREERISKEKQRIENEAQLLQRESEWMKRLMSYYLSFIKTYGILVNRFKELSKKVYSKDLQLGNDFDNMLKQGRQSFKQLAEEMISTEDINRLFDIDDSTRILNHNDRLFLFLLSSGADKEQIAAMLNTSTSTLKTKKWQLKDKIIKNATNENRFSSLLHLFHDD